MPGDALSHSWVGGINEPLIERPSVMTHGRDWGRTGVLKLDRLSADTNRKDHHCAKKLSARQLEILHHLAQGKQNKRIAHDLGISENTVKVHMRHIMKKLDAQNRTQVVLLHALGEWKRTHFF
jgi:DNA-binding NarL/FixJ family response regulator